MKISCVIFIALLAVQCPNTFGRLPHPEVESVAERSFGKQDCFKDTHEGPMVCMALMFRYKWSEPNQDCVKAVYGGCHETKNSFYTLEDCRRVTFPVCKSNL